MDQSKVQAVVEWPAPQSVKELQWFLGFANFYRCFIQNFSTVAASLTSLLRGSSRNLQWTPAASKAFEELKTLFTNAPILKHLDPSVPFMVDSGEGAILSQRHGSPSFSLGN